MADKKARKSFAPAKLSLSVALALAALGSTQALAFRIDTGNPDVALNWDTTIRYNAGWRMEGLNPNVANAFGTDETEARFKKHDMVTNRLDLYTEADYIVQNGGNKFGARVSAAAWSENAYSGQAHHSDQVNAYNSFLASIPAPNGPVPPVGFQNGGNGQYSKYAQRYLTGNSGEIVDAFVFATMGLADTTLSLKLGQHNLYWGEALYTVADSIANGMGPIDTIKAATSPGTEAKELFMPLNQISASWMLTDELSLLGYYTLDWKPFRVVPGGTFFAASDASGNMLGSDPLCSATYAGGGCIHSLSAVTPGRNGGDYGLAARWAPGWLQGTAGLYYRKYDERLPWSSTQLANFNPTNLANLGVRLAFARNTEMFGASLNKVFDSYSTGIEVSYRRNTALNSVGGFMAGSQGLGLGFFASPAANIPLTTTPTYAQVEGARGDTYHLVVNSVVLLNKTALWETGNMQFEFNYQRLDKVTKNPDLYYSADYACKTGYLPGGMLPGQYGNNKKDGCATKDSLAFNLGFNPQWMEVLPATDVTMPISVSYGLMGNSPTLAGSYEGAYSWSVGLKAVYQSLYEFGLALNDKYQPYNTTTSNSAGVPGQALFANGSAPSPLGNSHRWLSLRFKTTF